MFHCLFEMFQISDFDKIRAKAGDPVIESSSLVSMVISELNKVVNIDLFDIDWHSTPEDCISQQRAAVVECGGMVLTELQLRECLVGGIITHDWLMPCHLSGKK